MNSPYANSDYHNDQYEQIKVMHLRSEQLARPSRTDPVPSYEDTLARTPAKSRNRNEEEETPIHKE